MFSQSALLLIVATSVAFVTAFPDGAPADTCVKNNRPKHGQTQPKGLQSIPYQLVASTDQFGPGAEVQSNFFNSFPSTNYNIPLNLFSLPFSCNLWQ